MRRRQFITLLGGAAAAWPLAARAREGGNVVIEYRWADGHYERLPALLAELIASKVDVIVTHGTPGALAAKQATTTIPIVIAVVGDAVSSDIVSNLAHPDANITGSTFFQPELAAKRLDILHEAMPNLTEFGVMLNLANRMNEPILPQMSEVASSRRLTLRQFDARSPADFDGVMAAMAANVGAFVLLDDSVLIAGAPEIGKLALQRRLPSIGFPDYATAGGLMAFGVNFVDLFRRAAAFVDKIFKGAKPGDLPFERATKFETIVNLKTAKVLGVELPTSVLARRPSDRVNGLNVAFGHPASVRSDAPMWSLSEVQRTWRAHRERVDATRLTQVVRKRRASCDSRSS